MSSAVQAHVVAALLVRDGRALVAQRPPGKARALQWELPGGKIEPGETGPGALVRECREELACEVSVGERIDQVIHRYADLEVHLSLYQCSLVSGEPRPVEALALRWVRQGDLADLPFTEADGPLLRHIP
jgi:8-oxo-dGTP diphosphatase